jgi:hypothetical protein
LEQHYKIRVSKLGFETAVQEQTGPMLQEVPPNGKSGPENGPAMWTMWITFSVFSAFRRTCPSGPIPHGRICRGSRERFFEIERADLESEEESVAEETCGGMPSMLHLRLKRDGMASALARDSALSLSASAIPAFLPCFRPIFLIESHSQPHNRRNCQRISTQSRPSRPDGRFIEELELNIKCESLTSLNAWISKE